MADPFTLDSLAFIPQRSVMHLIDKHSRDDLLNRLHSVRDRARLKSLGLAKSGVWLNALPSKNLCLHLKPREFRVSLQYRLGIPVFRKSGPCPACKADSDKEGDHAIACGWEGERIARHNQLRDALFQTASQAALGPRKEEQAILL